MPVRKMTLKKKSKPKLTLKKRKQKAKPQRKKYA